MQVSFDSSREEILKQALLQVTFKGQPATWNSGVQIKKCRYLEASGCVALCVNLCKVSPSPGHFQVRN